MSRRRVGQEHIRKIQHSHRSYYVRLPIHLVRKFGWQEHQKVTVREYGENKLIIEDWEDGLSNTN